MSKHPATSGKNDAGEYDKFSEALKKVLSVPHSEIKARLEQEKAAKKRPSTSSRVSREKH